MDDESLDSLERQLAAARPPSAPAGLRNAVLTDVQRELRAARWDRRLARAAVVLLIVGVGTNAAIGLRPDRFEPRQLAGGPTQESLIEVAVTVAEATDAATGSRFAQQWAALAGRELSGEEVAMIDAAVGRTSNNVIANGNEG